MRIPISLLALLGSGWVVTGCKADAEVGNTHTDGTEDTDGMTEGESEDGTSTGSSDTDDTGDSTDEVKLDVGAPDMGGPDLPPNCVEAAMQETNQGCEFWAVDLPMVWFSEDQEKPAPQEGQFAVAIANASANDPATVRVYLGDSDEVVDQAVVEVDALHVFELPAQNIDAQSPSDDGVAYRVSSDVPVTAYQFNTLEQASSRFSADASLLLPTPSLRDDYSVVTANSVSIVANILYGAAFISVVATEDDTIVDLYAEAPLRPGVPDKGVVLSRGDVYTALAAEEGNLSASRVVADKPVAVFAGNVGAREPLPEAPCCSDHTEEQIQPISAWGDRYLVAPPRDQDTKGQAGNILATYRFVGLVDATGLDYDPAPPANAPLSLDAGEVAYFSSDQAFSVEGTQAFGVAQFTVGSAYSGTPLGDPAMVMLPATGQLQDEYVFLTPPTFAQNWLSVIRPVGTPIELDGQPLDETPEPVGALGGTMYELLQVPVDEGPHWISGDAPFQITAIGYADAVAYAYAGGSGLKFLTEPPPVPEG